MKRVFIPVPFLTALAWGAPQSLVYPASAGSFTAPNSAPFTSLQSTRIAFRLHNWTFASGSTLMTIGPFAVAFSATGNAGSSGSQFICVADTADSSPNYGNTACAGIAGRSDIVVLIQRAATAFPAGNLELEIWDTATGGNYAATACSPAGPCPISTINVTNFHGAQTLGGTSNPTAEIAWLQWWAESTPLAGPVPLMTASPDLGNWIFNGNCSSGPLVDSGPYKMKIAVSHPACGSMPTYPPVCRISANLTAGGTGTLDGAGSYAADGTLLSYSWQPLNDLNPASLTLSSSTAVQPVATAPEYGVYAIQLTVSGPAGSSSCIQRFVTNTPTAAGYINTTIDADRIPSFAVLYNDAGWTSAQSANLPNWLASRFTYFDGGNVNMLTYLPSGWWFQYADSAYVCRDQMYKVIADSVANSYQYENALNHAAVDYIISNSAGYTLMDMFDAGEIDSATQVCGGYPSVSHGVFVDTTDVTTAAYDGSAPFTVPNGGTLYIGYFEPFALATVALNTARNGGSVAWQYWNGAWNALTVTDRTSGLSASGTLSFTPPADWVRRVWNGSRSKYWIRATVYGTSTAPVVTTIKGDPWNNGGVSNLRGWSSTDTHRVNVGLGNLEYNPAPPPGQSAHFRYQARLAANSFQGNSFMGLPTSTQWPQFLADTQASPLSATGPNAQFFDDGWRGAANLQSGQLALATD